MRINNKRISAYAIPGILIRATSNAIDKAVCEIFEIEPDQLRRRSRLRPIVEARHTAMYFYCLLTTKSLTEIGADFGGFDHCTVIHAKRTVSDLEATNNDFRAKLKAVKGRLICG